MNVTLNGNRRIEVQCRLRQELLLIVEVNFAAASFTVAFLLFVAVDLCRGWNGTSGFVAFVVFAGHGSSSFQYIGFYTISHESGFQGCTVLPVGAWAERSGGRELPFS